MSSTVATTALEQWLRDNGGFLHPNLRIANDEDTGIHWHAGGPIEPGTHVLTVPNSLSLSYLNGLVDDAFPVFTQHRDAFKVEAIGFFYLMAQYIHRDSSFWRPYLDTLPSPDGDFSQPLWFESKSESALLEGTDVWHAAEERRKVYEQYYESGIAAFADSGIDVAPYTWHLFKWAVTMFSSRSFTSRSLQPQDNSCWPAYKSNHQGVREAVLLDLSSSPADDLIFPALFPVMDASNHQHNAKVEWNFSSEGFSLRTLDGAEANSQLWNNYGAKPNDELFLGYGFCIPENPHDTVLMTLKPPPEDLQGEIKVVHPEYFRGDSSWDSDKATFRLALPSTFDEIRPAALFTALPEPLFELLVYILRHERGLSFVTITDATNYLTSPESTGRRYLPHVARMLVQSLAPKMAKLPPVTMSPPPGVKAAKHLHASTYVESQRQILSGLITHLKSFTRSLILLPHESRSQRGISSDSTASATATIAQKLDCPHLLTLEGLHAIAFPQSSTSSGPSPFQLGLALSTGSPDLEQLRLAGWEDDAFVLLLCWMYLSEHPLMSGTALPEYIPTLHEMTAGRSEEGQAIDSEQEARVEAEVMSVIQDAAEVFPDSTWGDGRWCAKLVAGVGGKMIGFEGMMVMCPAMDYDDRDERMVIVGEEARLCVYLHA